MFDHLHLYSWIFDLQSIPNASIPVVKFSVQLFAFSGDFADGVVNVDLTFNDNLRGGRHLGNSSLRASQELLEEYPALKDILIVLKHLLSVHGMNSSYNGGISSYSLLIWVVAFINSLESPLEDYGELLIQFLGFFGKKFDMDKVGVNVHSKGGFFKVESCRGIVTVDPACPSNNTTRSSFNVERVLALFAAKHTLVTNRKTTKNLLAELFKPI